jgi:hypothetical protein
MKKVNFAPLEKLTWLRMFTSWNWVGGAATARRMRCLGGYFAAILALE